jgi:hypothetical protein
MCVVLVTRAGTVRADDGEQYDPVAARNEAAEERQEAIDAQREHDEWISEQNREDPSQRHSDDSDSDDSVSSDVGWLMLFAGAMIAIPVIAGLLYEDPEPPPKAGQSDAAANNDAHHDTEPSAQPTPASQPRAAATQQELAQQNHDAALQRAVVVLLVLLVLSLSYTLFFVLCTWRLFSKAGRPGWAALVPLYNWWLFLEIGGMPGWLIFFPFINGVVTFCVVPFGFARHFGRSAIFALGLLFAGVIFYPWLAFSSSKYSGVPQATS